MYLQRLKEIGVEPEVLRHLYDVQDRDLELRGQQSGWMNREF